MSYAKRLAIGVTVGISIPIAAILLVNCTRPLTISDLPVAERDALDSVGRLNINVFRRDSVGCDFRSRGRLTLSTDTDDGRCHVTEFELLPSAVVPVGVKDNVAEETHRKLVNALGQLRYLQRVVLPDAATTNISRLRHYLPDCDVFSLYSDLRPYSAKVRITSTASGP